MERRDFIHCLAPKKVGHSNILLVFCFDYGAYLLCYFFDNLMQFFPSRAALIFGRDFVLMTGQSNHSFSLFRHISKTFNGVEVRTLWPIHV